MTAAEPLFLDAPSLGESEMRWLCRSVSSGFVSTAGPMIGRFETRIADFLHASGAVALQSGTAALHMALLEAGVGRDDEVIVPALTFIATVNPVLYVGAKPVFVDVDARTWNMDPVRVSQAMTPKTKAILPVHLYGNPCNMEAIGCLARRYNLAIIEDATEALGAKFKGKNVGTLGTFGCFSFNGNKIITTGGGGMVVSRRRRALSHIRFLVNQARSSEESYSHPEMGYNLRMTNIEAALGLSQMSRIAGFLKKKRAFYEIYREELAKSPVVFQHASPRAESSWWFTAILLESRKAVRKLQRGLAAARIPSRRIFPPVPEQPPYQQCNQRQYPNTIDIYERGLCLPASTLNTSGQVAHVAKTIRTIMG